MLYPAELCTHIFKSGAGEGDRTLTAGLEGRNSTIELHPHIFYILVLLIFLGGGWWIRTTESIANRFTVCPLWPLGKSSVFGAGNRTRTYNLLITSQLLYQLSHTSILILKLVATWKGLEPSTSSVTGWHSNQLNYQAAFMYFMVGPTGLEPVTPCL